MTAFWPTTWELEFCQIRDLLWNMNNNISFHFRLVLKKTNDKSFKIIKKTLSWGHFGSFLLKYAKMPFTRKMALSVFEYFNFLTSCKKSETNDLFLRKMLNQRTDRQTDRWTGRQRWFYRTLQRSFKKQSLKWIRIACLYKIQSMMHIAWQAWLDSQSEKWRIWPSCCRTIMLSNENGKISRWSKNWFDNRPDHSRRIYSNRKVTNHYYQLL